MENKVTIDEVMEKIGILMTEFSALGAMMAVTQSLNILEENFVRVRNTADEVCKVLAEYNHNKGKEKK